MKRLPILAMFVMPGLAGADQDYWTLPSTADCQTILSVSTGEKLLYPREGHLSTTGVVAFVAGYSFEDAGRLACYSQMPDAQAWSLSAPMVGTWGLFAPGYRRLIVDVLHSLHGGDAAAVQRRRQRLAEMVQESLRKQAPAWQAGFLIHAMGDSYAHVHGHAGELEAYGPGVGHIFAFCEKPDDIAHGDNIDHYRAYVRALYEALGGGEEGRAALDDFLQTVSAAAVTGDRAAVIKAINAFPLRLPSGSAGASRLGGPARQEVSKAEAKAFLRSVRAAL